MGVSRGTTGVLKLLSTEELQQRQPPALQLYQLLPREFLPQQVDLLSIQKNLYAPELALLALRMVICTFQREALQRLIPMDI